MQGIPPLNRIMDNRNIDHADKRQYSHGFGRNAFIIYCPIKPYHPKYKNNNINSDVNRASQTHQVPHIGFPHNEPVNNAIKVKLAPIGALLMATISASLMRQTRLIAPATAMTI